MKLNGSNRELFPTMQAIFPTDEASLNALVATISKPRLAKYLVEAQGQNLKALQLYHWNAQLSQALYLSLQSWEISLRNKLNSFLCWKYNTSWPFDQRFRRNLLHKDLKRLEEVIKRQSDHRHTKQPETNHIVAVLTAGFWVSQLGKGYTIPYGWKNNLKFRIFVNEPTLTRDDASEICDDILDLRNRVAHHEPVFLLELQCLKEDIDYLVRAMCLGTAAYLTSACSFEQIWQQRP